MSYVLIEHNFRAMHSQEMHKWTFYHWFPFIGTNFNSLHPSFEPSLVEIWPIGSGEEDENVKSLQTDKPMDNRRQEKLTWAFGSGELKI